MTKATSPVPATPTKSAGRPKASEVEARTQELIDAAGCLFIKHGYAGVSLEAIARQARVAVRTIYVKFGGKAGLLKAVLQARRERFFPVGKMDVDQRPVREVIDEFAGYFYDMLCEPDAMILQRVVMAEASSNPELAETFYEAGPRMTRDMLERYFARPDVRAQLRPDVPVALLPAHLIACVNGDPVVRYLFPEREPARAEARRMLAERLELFYRSIF
ncbi:TetR/AcrR family transcriptional regulator [Massilia sp. LC238]|uniref:TetR/AcrR family transcriptional regulator n=1 Tax=Massilia sp. LC238 TaxID=1502852 RepID=UPI0004E34B4E|nr:TetR/AcrR family transcriptional regulator [Massilia sp. LC238]KFC65623.1 Transcriptional regulator TetR family protein [Massilia sp. LC238]